MNNAVSMPVVVTHKAKLEKPGAVMKEQFLTEISVIQTCLTIPSERHIHTPESTKVCSARCEECMENKANCSC